MENVKQPTGIIMVPDQGESDPTVTDPTVVGQSIANQIEAMDNRRTTGVTIGLAAGGVTIMSEIVGMLTYASARAPYDLPQNFESDRVMGTLMIAIGGLALASGVAATVRGYFAGRRAEKLRKQAQPIAYQLGQIDPPDIRTAYFKQ